MIRENNEQLYFISETKNPDRRKSNDPVKDQNREKNPIIRNRHHGAKNGKNHPDSYRDHDPISFEKDLYFLEKNPLTNPMNETLLNPYLKET